MSEQPQPAQAADPDSTAPGLTLRSGVIAFCVLLVLAYYLPDWMIGMKGGTGGGGYMPLVAFTAVLVLLAIKRLPAPLRIRFSRGEILTVFFVLTIGLGMLHAVAEIVASLASPYYYASPENNYGRYFITEIPSVLVPFDPLDATRTSEPILRLYRGGSEVPWEVWLGPLAWWIGLLFLIFAAQYFIGSLLRRQWLEHEKLMFPHAGMLASLLEEENGQAPILEDRLFWTGAGVSGFIFLLDGLHRYVPEVPFFGLGGLSLKPFLVEAPWDAMLAGLSVQPYLVGISYLLTTEITFSIWFFALLDNLFRAAGSAFTLPGAVKSAWTSWPLNSGSDTVGAIAVFMGALLWTGREHFKMVLQRAIGGPAGDDEKTEMVGYRMAFWGFCLSAAGIMLWCAAVGISFWYSALIFSIYALAVIFVSRLVAETGLISPQDTWPPHTVALKITGYPDGGAAIGAAAGVFKPPLLKTFSVFSYMWAPLLTGPHMLPLILLGAKATDGTHGRRRWLFRLTFVGMPLAMGVFVWRFLTHAYEVGALNTEFYMFQSHTWLFGNSFVRDILLREQSWSTDWTEVTFMLVGGVVMGFLLYMRRVFYWWPLHPIGYVATGINRGLWFSVLVGWSIKRTVLKYGGGEAFKKLTPLFVGLFVGQFVMAALWRVVGILAGERGFTAGL